MENRYANRVRQVCFLSETEKSIMEHLGSGIQRQVCVLSETEKSIIE